MFKPGDYIWKESGLDEKVRLIWQVKKVEPASASMIYWGIYVPSQERFTAYKYRSMKRVWRASLTPVITAMYRKIPNKIKLQLALYLTGI